VIVTCNMHLRCEPQHTNKKGGGLEAANGPGVQVHPMAPFAVLVARGKLCMHESMAKMLQQFLPGMYVKQDLLLKIHLHLLLKQFDAAHIC
jgi:hypothetical protein